MIDAPFIILCSVCVAAYCFIFMLLGHLLRLRWQLDESRRLLEMKDRRGRQANWYADRRGRN